MQTTESFHARWLVAFSFATQALLAILSDGVHHEDGLAHFLIARGAWASPANFLDAWGRPGCTAPLSLVAAVGSAETGFLLARLLNAAMAAGCTWLTWRAAVGIGLDRPVRTALLLVSQPLFFLLGYATLTEMPCALYLMAALVAGLRGRAVLSAAALSLTFVTRHECVVLWAIWCLWWVAERGRGRLSTRRLFAALALTAWAPLAVNLAGWFVLGKVPWAVFLEARPEGGAFYGRGLTTTMITYAMVAAGPLTVLCLPSGLIALRARRGLGLVAGSFLAYLTAHTLCFAFNLFASGGYPRFLVAVAGPMALLAGAGLSQLLHLAPRDRGRAAWLLLGLWVLMAVAADVEMGRFIRLKAEASPYWPAGQWGVRALLAATVVLVLGRRVLGAAGWAAASIRALVAIGVAVQLINFAVFVRAPLRRTEQQARWVAAARQTAARYPDRVILASNEWIVFGLDRGRRVDVEYAWNRFEGAPAGALYLFDHDLAAADWRRVLGAPPLAYYENASRFRRLSLPAAGNGKIRLYEKR